MGTTIPQAETSPEPKEFGSEELLEIVIEAPRTATRIVEKVPDSEMPREQCCYSCMLNTVKHVVFANLMLIALSAFMSSLSPHRYEPSTNTHGQPEPVLVPYVLRGYLLAAALWALPL